MFANFFHHTDPYNPITTGIAILLGATAAIGLSYYGCRALMNYCQDVRWNCCDNQDVDPEQGLQREAGFVRF